MPSTFGCSRTANGPPLLLSPSENKSYFRTSAPHLKRTSAEEWRGRCLLHSGRNPSSFALDIANGLWYCFACGEGGDAYRFHERLYGVSFIEARNGVWDIVGRPLPQFTPQQKKDWVEKRHRDQEDEPWAEAWRHGWLLSLEWSLELHKCWLFETDGEEGSPLAETIRRETIRERELRSVSREELLSLYRQEIAADPLLAGFMIQFGQEELDSIHLEAATCVRMLEIEAVREQELQAAAEQEKAS